MASSPPKSRAIKKKNSEKSKKDTWLEDNEEGSDKATCAKRLGTDNIFFWCGCKYKKKCVRTVWKTEKWDKYIGIFLYQMEFT